MKLASVSLFLLVATLSVLALPRPSYAIRQYRCNGQVQYRPCEPGDALSVSPSAKTRRRPTPRQGVSRRRPSNPNDPVVIKQGLTRGKRGEGHWHGLVRGYGPIYLRLAILRHGRVESSRYMGSVLLEKPKTIPFNFTSELPKGRGWSSKVMAFRSKRR